MFSNAPKVNCKFSVAFILSSANAFNVGYFKIFLFGKELKAFADRQQNICGTRYMVCLEKGKNIVGREENAIFWHILFFSQCFQK